MTMKFDSRTVGGIALGGLALAGYRDAWVRTIQAKYEHCKAFVKEHPVETALGVTGTVLAGIGIYKLCTIPQVEMVRVASQSTATQYFAPAVTETSDQATALAARSYSWHEESHFVRGHDRHYADGRIANVSPYSKVTGGKV